MSYEFWGVLALCVVAWYATNRHNRLLWFKMPNYSIQERQISRRGLQLHILSTIVLVAYAGALIMGEMDLLMIHIPVLYGFYCVWIMVRDTLTSRQEIAYPKSV